MRYYLIPVVFLLMLFIFVVKADPLPRNGKHRHAQFESFLTIRFRITFEDSDEQSSPAHKKTRSDAQALGIFDEEPRSTVISDDDRPLTHRKVKRDGTPYPHKSPEVYVLIILVVL